MAGGSLPLDLSYSFHLLVGWLILGVGFLHVLFHVVRTLRGADGRTAKDLFRGPAISGWLLAFFLALMGLTALPRFRRARWFHVFFAAHHLFVFVFLLLFIHGEDHWGP